MSLKYLALCALCATLSIASITGLLITGEIVLIVAEVASLCMMMHCARRVTL